MPIVEYRKGGEPFPGVVGRTADESSPAWPALAWPAELPRRPAVGLERARHG